MNVPALASPKNDSLPPMAASSGAEESISTSTRSMSNSPAHNSASAPAVPVSRQSPPAKKEPTKLSTVLLNLNFSSQPPQHLLDFSKTLPDNEDLDYVEVYVGPSYKDSRNVDPYQEVLENIGKLPKLQIVCFTTAPKLKKPRYPKGLLPARVVAHVLSTTRHLEAVMITDVELIGTQADFDLLAQELQRLWYMSRFTLQNVDFTLEKKSNSNPIGSPVDGLLTSLAILPSLGILDFSHAHAAKDGTPNKAEHQISTAALSMLFLSSSLRYITLRNWNITNDHLASLASTLEFNANAGLQVLSIGPIQDLNPISQKALCQMLQGNSEMVHLELTLKEMLSDASITGIAQALHRSRGLRKFSLRAEKGFRIGRVSVKAKKALMEALQANFILQDVFLFSKPLLKTKIDYYMRLNRVGRERLLLNPDHTRGWMSTLSRAQDLDTIFYLLQNNPNLCAQAVCNKRQAPQQEHEQPCKKQRL